MRTQLDWVGLTGMSKLTLKGKPFQGGLELAVNASHRSPDSSQARVGMDEDVGAGCRRRRGTEGRKPLTRRRRKKNETGDSGGSVEREGRGVRSTPDLQEVKVVLGETKLLHLAPLPLQLGDLQLQLGEEPLRPLLRRCLLPLDRLHQLRLDSLHGTHQSAIRLQTLHHVPFGVFLQMLGGGGVSGKTPAESLILKNVPKKRDEEMKLNSLC